MGISQDEAAGFEGVMKGIFANNFGESFDDIGKAITTISQNLGEMPDATLQGIAEDAFRLRDAFDLDVNESVMAAKNLMTEFGLSGEQAMDFIASGMQEGLNASGDFVESISEYGNLFNDAGFSAEQMYSIMATGAETGILGVDKIADAVKEMGIKLGEGSDDTKSAFDQIGLSFDDIAGSVADGSADWGDYFDVIVGGIEGIEDPIERQKAQVAIFGTMAEDLGVSFTKGLSAATASLEDMSQATESLDAQYDNWPSMWEGIKRSTQLALKPLGDALLKIGNDLMPVVQDAFEWVGRNLPPIIDVMVNAISTAVAFFQAIKDGKAPIDAIRNVLTGLGVDVGEVEGKAGKFATMLQNVFGPTVERIKVAILGFRSDMEPLKPLFDDLGAAVQRAWVVIGPALKALGVVAAAVGAAILNLWGNQLAAMFEALPGIIGGVVKVITGIINSLVSLFEGAVKAIQLLLEGDFIGAFEAAKEGVQGWIDGTVSALEGLVDIIEGLFQIIYDSIVNTINDMTGSTIASFDEMKSSLLSAAEPILEFFGRVKEFGTWLSDHIFNFDINLPELPEWAKPGSPIPLHTAWANFLSFLKNSNFEIDIGIGVNGSRVDVANAISTAGIIEAFGDAIRAISASIPSAVAALKELQKFNVPGRVG
jgi:TP901 family phage tail tape measure protein